MIYFKINVDDIVNNKMKIHSKLVKEGLPLNHG
jgi:hypothetical protein